MDMILTRCALNSHGIFSILTDKENNDFVAVSLEHAYAPDGPGFYSPKIPDGEYTCERGAHRLHGMDHNFETFEIKGVPDHSGILFHWGNFNRDSDGCVLLGQRIGEIYSERAIINSMSAFQVFMKLQQDKLSFNLTVRTPKSANYSEPGIIVIPTLAIK